MKLFIISIFIISSIQTSFAVEPNYKKVLTDYEAKGFSLETLCDINFNQITFEELNPPWIVYKGEYKVLNNALTGFELASDHHVATSGMNLNLKHQGFIYFELKLQDASNIIVTLNGKGRGHVCRAVLSKKFIRVQSDNKGKAVNITQPLKLKSDQLYKVLIKLDHDTLSLNILNAEQKETLTLQNNFIHHPIDNIRWAVAKGPAIIDNIFVTRAFK